MEIKNSTNANTVWKHFWKNGVHAIIWWSIMIWNLLYAESAVNHLDKKAIINIMWIMFIQMKIKYLNWNQVPLIQSSFKKSSINAIKDRKKQIWFYQKKFQLFVLKTNWNANLNLNSPKLLILICKRLMQGLRNTKIKNWKNLI